MRYSMGMGMMFLVLVAIAAMGVIIFVQGLNLGGTANPAEEEFGLGTIFLDVIVAGFVFWRFARR